MPLYRLLFDHQAGPCTCFWICRSEAQMKALFGEGLHLDAEARIHESSAAVWIVRPQWRRFGRAAIPHD